MTNAPIVITDDDRLIVIAKVGDEHHVLIYEDVSKFIEGTYIIHFTVKGDNVDRFLAGMVMACNDAIKKAWESDHDALEMLSEYTTMEPVWGDAVNESYDGDKHEYRHKGRRA